MGFQSTSLPPTSPQKADSASSNLPEARERMDCKRERERERIASRPFGQDQGQCVVKRLNKAPTDDTEPKEKDFTGRRPHWQFYLVPISEQKLKAHSQGRQPVSTGRRLSINKQ